MASNETVEGESWRRSSPSCSRSSASRRRRVSRAGAAARPRGLRAGGATPQGWWAAQAEQLDWFRLERVLDDADPPFYKWFVGGTLNASYNCLDRHVDAGSGERVAFHWRGEDGEERDITYAQLLGEVKRFANALKDLGVGKGDVVGIYLPMIPEVAVAMLACARIGAPTTSSSEASRQRPCASAWSSREAKVLITVDGAARKGKTAPVKERVDEVMRDLADAAADRRRAQQGHAV